MWERIPLQTLYNKFIHLSFDLISRSPYTTRRRWGSNFESGSIAAMNLASAGVAWRLVLFQLAITILIFLVLIYLGWVYAWSGLIGGMIATVTNAFFALRVFRHYRAQEPGILLRQFYGAEVQKLLLIGMLFAAAFIWVKTLSAGALFGAFLLVQMAPVVIAHKLD